MRCTVCVTVLSLPDALKHVDWFAQSFLKLNFRIVPVFQNQFLTHLEHFMLQLTEAQYKSPHSCPAKCFI